MKINIKEMLFWVSLVVAVVLLFWYLFGNSPSEFLTLVAIILMVVMKMWSMSDQLIKLEIRTKNSFDKMRDDMDLIKKKLGVK